MADNHGMLSKRDIYLVVHKFIGVEGGYLNGFSYQSHYEFYIVECDLEIDTQAMRQQRVGGISTKDLFVEILENAEPAVQARILKGVLNRFPLNPIESRGEKAQVKAQIEAMIARLEQAPAVTLPDLDAAMTEHAAREALADAKQLLKERGPVSALDRVHTALVGYLRGAAKSIGADVQADESVTATFTRLLKSHPALLDLGHRAEELQKSLRSASAILDALNTLRNRASVAHVNTLLGEDEAMLMIDLSSGLLRYLSAKLKAMPQADDLPF